MGKDYSNHNILFVDDEKPVLDAIKRGLHKESYNLFFTHDPFEALDIIKQEDISLIVTDMRMPGMDGLKLLKEVNKINKNIIKIILSGYANSTQIIATINSLDIYKFLLKPWDLKTDLKPAIENGLDQFEMKRKEKFSIKSAKNRNEVFKKMVENNKQTVASLKKEFYSLSRLNKMSLNYSYFLALQLKRGKITESRYKNELNFLEDYIEKKSIKYPVVFQKNSIEKLSSNFKNFFIEYFNENSFTLVNNIKDDFFVNISIDELIDFFKLMFDHMLEIKNKTSLAMIFSLKDERGVFLIKVKECQKNTDQLHQNTVYILLNTLADILNFSLEIKDSDKEDILIILKFNKE
ncbi:MAG: response regulator [Bacillota bacterium]